MAMNDLDLTCGGLLPLIGPIEAAPAVRDDRGEAWLTREQIRAASLQLAGQIASTRKQLVFLFCGASSETLIGLLAAAAAGHATALIDPSLAEDRLKGLIDAYQPELVLGARDFGEKLRAVADASADTRSLKSQAGVVEWIARDAETPSVPIDPALGLLLSTSGTTGSRKYVRLSRDAIVANARQIAGALAIDDVSVGVAHLPLHYSYGLSVVTSHLAVGGRVCLVNDAITSPSFWSKIGHAGGSHFPGVPFHYAALARLGAGLIPDSVKVFTQAGGALDPRIQAKIHDWAAQRGGRFFVMYGQTEASPRMTTLQHADFARKTGSVGVALAGGRLSIVDDQGRAPAGRRDRSGGLRRAQRHAGLRDVQVRPWQRRRDEGPARNRRSRAPRRRGISLPDGPRQALRQDRRIPARAGRDRTGAHRVCPVACLDFGDKIAVVHEQESETALKSRVRELAANYKVPSSSFALRKVEQIPRGASGKIDYARLKDLVSV